MHDGADLAFVNGAPAVQRQHHRCAGFFLLAHKQRRLGQRQVDARRLDRRDGVDRACQLAFERALVVDLFGKLAGAEFLVVHQLKADRAALGQAFGRQAQARFRHLALFYQQRAAVLGELVGHIHFLQRGDDGPAVALRQVAVKHAVVGLAAPHPQRGHDRQGKGRANDQRQLRVGAQLLQERTRVRQGLCASGKQTHAFTGSTALPANKLALCRQCRKYGKTTKGIQQHWVEKGRRLAGALRPGYPGLDAQLSEGRAAIDRLNSWGFCHLLARCGHQPD